MNKVIFLHILKCGGTSMKYMLYEQYGVGYFHPVPISTMQGVVGYPALRGVDALTWQGQMNIETAQYYGCIAGHYDWGLTEKLPDWTVMVMMRHPVEQLRSLYQFMCASKHELGDIVDWMQTAGFNGWIQSEHVLPYLNLQTCYLSGHWVRDVEIAIQNLQQDRVIFGLVERYLESVDFFNQRMGWQMTMQHRLEARTRMTLDAETYQLVEHLQVDDMRLYAEACALFERQLDDFKAKTFRKQLPMLVQCLREDEALLRQLAEALQAVQPEPLEIGD